MRICCSVVVLFLAGAASAFACPACPTDLGLTVAEEVAGADIALIVEWVAATPADVDAGLPGKTEYRVVTVLGDETGRIAAGDPISTPRHRAGGKGDHFLLLGLADGLLRWSSAMPLSADATEYIRQAPAPDVDRLQRLRFFARHFEHPDLMIANDAFAEFAAARYEDVVAVVDEFDVDDLRNWLADEATNPLRMGLYGLLLGQRGDAEDAEFLKQEILRPDENSRFGLEGMISGYLLLTREEGLPVIEDRKLRDRDVNFSETYAAMQSLRFMWSYTDGVISQERLRSAMRILLDRPELAELVITDLARWQDWSIADRLMEMYGAEEYNIPSIRRAIVRYLLLAERSKGEHLAQVRRFLTQLRETDPDIVEQTERAFLLY